MPEQDTEIRGEVNVVPDVAVGPVLAHTPAPTPPLKPPNKHGLFAAVQPRNCDNRIGSCPNITESPFPGVPVVATHLPAPLTIDCRYQFPDLLKQY
jgi:hypothetical protein